MSKTKTERTLTGTARPEAFKKKAGLDEALIEQWLAEVIPFHEWPPEVRKRIYTTNAMESLNVQLRKGLKNRGHFPSEAAAHQFTLKFGERFISPPSATEKR